MHRGRASSSRLGTTYKSGRVTREAIVRAAETVLIEDGLARFSIQRVASKIGISPGNLNYYFPTKASLLETLIVYTLAQYRHRVRVAAKQTQAGMQPALGEMLQWLMRDAISDHTNRLFRELWAIALHDPRVAKAMDSFYTRSVTAHLRRVAHGPGARCDRENLEATVYLMHLISEGATVIFGTRRGAERLFTRVQEMAHRAIMHLLTQSADAAAEVSTKSEQG
jgi:AcrR family transcriptional regulator